MISAYIRRQRLVNGLLTGLMIAGGLAMMTYASINIVSDVSVEPEQKKIFAAALEKRCQQELTTLGFTAVKVGNELIRVRGQSMDSPLEQLANASVGIQQCAGYTFTSFCMGPGCSNGFVNFELRPVEGSKR